MDGGDGAAWLGATIAVEVTMLDDAGDVEGAGGAAELAGEVINAGVRIGSVLEALALGACGLFGEAERPNKFLALSFHESR
jgi:hypothetical protein